MRLIDADALVKCFTDWVTETNSVEHYSVVDVVRIIENAPTVSPDMAQVLAYECGKDSVERKRGRWREYPIADGMNQCSECGVLRFGESNFCPNCGAEME